MKGHWILALQIVFLHRFGFQCDEWEDLYGKVEHVTVLYRHGIRTPVRVYPTDPHNCLTLWSNGYGELTKEGVRQHHIMGSWLGERYAHLLPPNKKYNRSAIRVVSSDIDRCIMSAYANMAGMFPLSPENYRHGIDWYPVPIHTIPREYDNFLAFSRPCPRFKVEFFNFCTSEEYNQMLEKYKGVLNFAEHMSGWKMDHYNFSLLYDILHIESLYGLTIPRWTREMYPKIMAEFSGLAFAFQTWTPQLKRLKSGLLLDKLLKNIKQMANHNLSENISMYSAHDSTVANLLNAIGVYNFIAPPFAATVIFELRRTAGSEPVITIFYKNSTDPQIDPVPLCLPGCSFACPLSKVEKLWAPILVTDADWAKECAVS